MANTKPKSSQVLYGKNGFPTTEDALDGMKVLIDENKNRSNQTGPLNWAWATYGGTANTVTLAPAFARTAYVAGDEFRFRATAANTGATTINVGGLGAKAAVTVLGTALPAGYIRTGVDTVCVYDGTRFVVQREIERNSNGNGEYVRFADGTQICTHKYSQFLSLTNQSSGYWYDAAIWVYPSAFAQVPYIGCTVRISNMVTTTAAGDPALTTAPAYVLSLSALSGTASIRFSATGVWY